MMKSLAIFCGSNIGCTDLYREGAENLADVMSASGLTLIYGGASVGLMGIIANRMLQNGGKAVGVIPQTMVDVEIAHQHLTKLHIVRTMRERKALISELADGFIMLPGGTGSLDEFFEVLTLSQLGYHAKPCGILNIIGYYDGLLQFLDHAVKQGFMKQSLRGKIMVNQQPRALLDSFLHDQASHEAKWMKTATMDINCEIPT
jgi:uncharacterized protein (TIGR00730 family)